MARREPPIDPNGYFHVGSRGVYGRPIYNDHSERELFLSLYARWSKKYNWITLAWALLGNHFHFIVMLLDGDLTRGMRVIQSGYSRRMNEKYDETRMGHLVRHCFYAGALETNEAVLGAIRYVDLNPVRAGLCRRPEDWAYSSYAANVGLCFPRPFHAPDLVLELLGESTPNAARKAYAEYVQEELAEKRHVSWSDEGYDFVSE